MNQIQTSIVNLANAAAYLTSNSADDPGGTINSSTEMISDSVGGNMDDGGGGGSASNNNNNCPSDSGSLNAHANGASLRSNSSNQNLIEMPQLSEGMCSFWFC